LPPSCNVSAYSPRFLCKISEEHFGIFSTCPDDTINLDADDVLLIDLLSDLLFVHSSHFQDVSESPNPGKQVSLGTALSEFWPDFSQRGKAASIGDVLQHQAGLAKPFPSSLDCHAGPDGPSGSHNMQKKAMKKRVLMAIRL